MQYKASLRNTAYASGIVAISLLASGCEKELDFEYHDITPRTVIEGALTEEGADVAIRLTTPMDEPMDRTCLTDAAVFLTDLDADERITLIPDGEGHFRSATPGMPEHKYMLTVERDGKTYTSTSLMTRGPKIENLEFNWISMPYDDVAALQIAFADNDPEADGDCYWIRIYRNGKPYKWSAVKDDLAIDGIVYEVVTTTRKDTDEEEEDDLLEDGDEVKVTVTHISRVFYDYLQAISSDSNGPRMFGGDFCLGYFLAGEVSGSTTIFHPDRIEYAK